MKDDFSESIGQLHEYGLYLPTKTMLIVGEVNEDLFNNALKNLHILDSFDGMINIKLNSPGGDLCAARAIYDAIIGCKNYVRITCYGEVASAGTLILMAGDDRVMSINSKLLTHIGQSAIDFEHPRNIEEFYYNMLDDNAWIETIYLNRIKELKPKYTRDKLKDLLVFDKHIKPKEALELGLITHIGEVQ